MRWNNKLFPSLNFIKGKISPYGIKGILRHYQYCSDPKLGPGIVIIRRITCSFHSCTYIWSFYWYSKIKEAVNQPKYCRVHNYKYYQIIGCQNNWIIIFFDDGTYEEDFTHINRTIIDGNMLIMSLIIMEESYGAIDADDSSCHGYYIIKSCSSPYTLQG